MAVSLKPAGSDKISNLIAQYGCGPVKFAGTEEALYERHLLFDNIIDASQVSLRERFEAVALSVRDILSQRWIRTEQTYDRENPKRVYYLSIEFLLGRSLANNIENLLLDRERNDSNADTISTPDCRCLVRVIPTNEDLMIAWHTNELVFS